MHTTMLHALLVLMSADPAAADRAGVEFFEQKIRPVLVKHCYECHSAGKKQKGDLLVDTRDALRKGGKSGPAIVPGEPAKSLLIKAVHYVGDLEMPPKGKLPAAAIADLEKWVKMGAPDPRIAPAGAPALTWEKIVAERRGWWSWRPVKKPGLPRVGDTSWSDHPVDRFLLAELEKAKLKPAGEADRRTLLRRLSLVLTGLPPKPEEVEAFVRDTTPNAYEAAVDRLLASAHFGERWAQHWMDVVRYAETRANEWNYEVSFAFRYRDYLTRAFNDDVAYDQLIREHLAGDLLPRPRRNRAEGFNESVIGTAFYCFGERNVEDCTLEPQVAFDIVDNQIDTLGKAFQATTIACARCHDHKLDAVAMKDYYALVGILHSSRQVAHTIDRPEANVREMAAMRSLKAEIRKELARLWQRDADQMGRYLLAAEARRTRQPNAAALAKDLDRKKLERWVAVLQGESGGESDLFAAWRAATTANPDQFAAAWKKQADRWATQTRERAEFNRKNFREYADFRTGSTGAWDLSGHGLRDRPSAPGEVVFLHEGDSLVKTVLPAGCFTHLLSEKLNGSLRSPILPDKAGKFVSVEVMGAHSSGLGLISNNCVITDSNYRGLGDGRFEWLTFNVPDHPESFRTYLDLVTRFDNPKFPDPLTNQKLNYKDSENLRVPWDQAAANTRSYFGVRRAVFHDEPKPPQIERAYFRPLLEGPAPRNAAEAAERYAAVAQAALRNWPDRITDDDAQWIDGLLQLELLTNQTGASARLGTLVARYRALDSQLTLPRVVHGLADFGPGFEQPLFIRGDCKKPGERVPRRYLEVLARPGEKFKPTGSGRLELANAIASADNPLTARVMVNRVWQHLFGEGLVRTVDDFGHNGDKQPSHPELLDYLATRFVEDGWSVKRMIRFLVLTKAFRQANRSSPAGRRVDPENRLLHHFEARRLEAEAIRDAILAASGRLDLALYGPSIDPFRERQIPFQRLFSGPLDGRGRRSIYIKRTLMEAPSFLSAFNLPKGLTMQGRRDVTNVPAQALALLNDPFVLEQADVWGTSLAAGPQRTAAKRVEHMFQVALNRAPEPGELTRYEAMVARLAELHRVPKDEILSSPIIWRDVAHSLFNTAEFVYIP